MKTLDEAKQALARCIADYLGDREQSAGADDDELGPIRGTPLHDAVVAVEQHFPRAKLPEARLRDDWRVAIRVSEKDDQSDDDMAAAVAALDRLLEWAEATPGGATEPATVQSTNEDRDQWLYELKKEGGSMKGIQRQLADRIQRQLDSGDSKVWDPLDSPQGVGKAIDRYCKRHGYDPLHR